MNTAMLTALLGKDLKIYFANRFFALITGLVLVVYTLVFFLLPPTVDEALELGIYMAQMPLALEALLAEEEIIFYRAPSEAALRQAVLDGEIPAGYAFPDDTLTRLRAGERLAVTLYLSPDMPPEFDSIYAMVLEEFGFALSGQTLDIDAMEITLGPDMAGQQVALRQRMLPLLTVFVLMVECLGLASLISSEIEGGTLRALLVTPLTMSGLFAAKGIFGAGLAFLQALLLLLLTGGLRTQPLLILAALLLGSVMITGVAFLIASVGKDLLSVMGWGILAMLLLALPAFSVLIPGLATQWVKAIPSYYLVDAVYRVMNHAAGWGDVAGNLLALALSALLLLAAGVWVLKRKFR